MRLSAGGKRTNPYLTVRWVAPNPIAEKDLVGVKELVAEFTGATIFDAAKLVREFSASKPKPGAGPVIRAGNFNVWCAYTPPKSPHIELVIGIDLGATVEMSIGAATMQPDGTIVLDLRAEGPGRAIGEARISYPRSHPDYPDILAHLGGMRLGEHKPVPPWPDRSLRCGSGDCPLRARRQAAWQSKRPS